MNLFNRFVMAVLLLLGVIAFVALIFIALLFPHTSIGAVRDAANLLDENVSLGLQILVASIAALLAILGFLLLLLEVMPRAARGVQLTGVTGASAELTIEAIVNRLRYEIEAVPAVRLVKPTVVSKGKAIDVDLEVRTDPTIDVAAKTGEVSQIARDAVESQMGIKLRRLRIFVQHEPYPREARGRAPAQPAEPTEPLPSLGAPSDDLR